MYLSRHLTEGGARWALDGRYLPAAFDLDLLLELPAADVPRFLEGLSPRRVGRGPPPGSGRARAGGVG